jgi:hypothetical protein
MVPPFELVQVLSVEQQSLTSYSSGFSTSKPHLGFQFSASRRDEE